MKDVFISFSSKETEEAERICDFLEKQGLKCFISTRDLVSGQEYAEQLLRNIDEANGVVLLLSRASNVSPHVLREVEYAVSHHTPVLVYVLEEVTLSKSMEYYLMTHQWITLGMDQKPKLLEGIRNLPAKTENAGTENFTVQGAKKKVPVPVIASVITAVATVILVVLVLFIVKSVKKNQDRNTQPAMPENTQTNPAGSETTVTLLSADILTMKIFDAAEGGAYNNYEGVDYFSYENHIITDPALAILVRGNNDWGTSNIRTWLNADTEIVSYKDQAPERGAVDRPYSNEAGFLFQFSDKEKEALVPVSHDDTSDLVYLLASGELDLLAEADMHIYAEPSAACKEHEDMSPYDYYLDAWGVPSYPW